MTDQLPYPGPEKGDCGCGCGRFGLLKAANSRGQRCVRGCKCPVCRGRNNRRKGKDKQRAARKLLGIPGNSIGTDEEELWRGSIRVEVKSGYNDTMPVDTRYRAQRAQSDASVAIGDNRPFAAICMPPGMSDGYAIVRLSDVVAFAYAIVGADQT